MRGLGRRDLKKLTELGQELPRVVSAATRRYQVVEVGEGVPGDHTARGTALEPIDWLQMYNRAERYDALRKDPKADAIMKSIEQ